MKKSAVAALILFSSAASAQSMNAQTFYSRAIALQKKGALAIFSRGEIRALMQEGQAAGKKAGEQRRADVAAGRKARYCPPDQKTAMNSDEFMKRLGAIPAAERARIDMTEATTRLLATKYPCPR
jgi:hypothetical protein